MDGVIKLCQDGDLEKLQKQYHQFDVDTTNKLISTACQYRQLTILHWLYPLKIWAFNTNSDGDEYQYESIFCHCCRYGYLEAAKYLYYNFAIDAYEKKDEPFCLSCQEGHLEMAQWIYSLGGVNINCGDHHPISFAVYHGYLDMVKWLISLPTFDKSNLSTIFNKCCGRDIETAAYLFSLLPKNTVCDYGLIINKACTFNNLDIIKWVFSIHPDNHNILEYFGVSCRTNSLEIAKWLFSEFEIEIDIHYDPETEETEVHHNGIIFEQACADGYLDIIKWIYSISDIDIHDKEDFLFRTAISFGHLEVAKWIYNIDDTDVNYCHKKSLLKTCSQGYLSVTQWLYSLIPDETTKIIHGEDNQLIARACVSGNLKLVKWLYSLDTEESWSLYQTVVFHNTFTEVSERGHLEVLQWLYSQCEPFLKINRQIHQDIYCELFKKAVHYQHLEMAQWLTNTALPVRIGSEITCLLTHIPGRYDELFIHLCKKGCKPLAQWLFSKITLKNDNIRQFAFINSCQYNHLDIAQWLYTVCKIDLHLRNDEILKYACEYDNLEVVKWLYSLDENSYRENKELHLSIFKLVCDNGYPVLLEWLHQNKYLDNINDGLVKKCFINCCRNNTIEIAKWISSHFTLEANIPEVIHIYRNVCDSQFEMTKFLHSIGYHDNPDSIAYVTRICNAIFGNNLEMAQWLYDIDPEHQNSFPDEMTFRFYHNDEVVDEDDDDDEEKQESLFVHTCREGWFDCAKWLYKISDKLQIINKQLLKAIIINGEIDMVKWLYSLDDKDKIKIELDLEYLFVVACQHNHLSLAKWLYSLDTDKLIDIHKDDQYLFKLSCKYGYLNQVKWLYSLGGVDLETKSDNPFYLACENGHLEVAIWLYNLKVYNIVGDKYYVDGDYCFINACAKGYLRLAKWLHRLGISIRDNAEATWIVSVANNNLEMVKWLYSSEEIDVRMGAEKIQHDYAYQTACKYGYTKLINWLKWLESDYSYELDGDTYICLIKDYPYPVEYHIKHQNYSQVIELLKLKKVNQLVKNNQLVKSDLDEKTEDCVICYEAGDTITSCGHYYCLECLLKWYQKPCAYCQQQIIYEESSTSKIIN